MIVSTPQNLTNSRRRQERRLQSASRVVDAMRRGQSLHCCFDLHEGLGATWRLSGGRRVANHAAELAICNPSVVASDATLFPTLQLHSQAYRFTPTRGEPA
jgi:hypothetical protein